MNRTTGPCVLLVLASCLAAPGWLTSAVLAQGTSGTLPGPISSRQLMRYADRLELSAQQRMALESFHDEYRREFRLLREGDVAVFLEEQGAMQGGIPQRERVENLVEKMYRIEAKIKSLDERFFDRLEPILSESQLGKLPRVRLARARARYAARQQAAQMGVRPVDLSGIVSGLDLEPSDFEPADAIMARYERQLTVLFRKQNEATINMALNVMVALEERGYADISQEELMADPELLQKIVGEIQSVYAELNAEVAKTAADISRLNRQTYRSVAQILPATQARELRNEYYRSAYRQLAPVVSRAEEDWMASAVDLEDLTDEQRAAVGEASGQFQRGIDRLLDDGVQVIEDFWAGFSPLEMDQERSRVFGEDLAALRQRAEGLQKDTAASLEGALGAETVAQIRQAALARAEADSSAATGDRTARATSQQRDTAEPFVWSGDQFLPPRISEHDLRRYAREIDLDEPRLEALLQEHQAYVQRIEALEPVEELKSLNESLRQTGTDGGEAPARTPAMIDRVYELRLESLEAIREVDRGFFDRLAEAAGPDRAPVVERFRRARLRRTFAGSASGRFTIGRDRSSESSVDLSRIVTRQSLSEDAAARVDPILAVYEDRCVAALRDRLEAQLELQRLSDRWALEIESAASENIAAVVELQAQYQEIMKPPTERVHATNDAIIALNRQTLEEVVAAIEPASAHALQEVYERKAFPTIFDDPAAVHDHLTSALQLEDLTAQQRLQLNELATTYRPEYQRLSHAMIGHVGSASPSAVGLDADDFKAWQKNQQELSRLRFDRNELNARAISRMRSVLTPEQVEHLGGLPEPHEDADFDLFR